MYYSYTTPIAALSQFEFNPLYNPMNNRKIPMMTRKERYTFARYFPAAQLSVILLCVLLLVLPVSLGLYTPKGKGQGGGLNFDADIPIFVGLVLLYATLSNRLPIGLLRRRGVADRQIYRLKQISQKANAGWVQLAATLVLIFGTAELTLLSVKWFGRNAWVLVYRSEMYGYFAAAILPAYIAMLATRYAVLTWYARKGRCVKTVRKQGGR
ncbi:hypothetical protein [Kingella denitrificans]|uniref:hypothetical protein n=1 Tax=Kingella denitrificans TaxID=502 RepID=UPI00288A2025|nr:hypothetical protein [Kingella denitrificans]